MKSIFTVLFLFFIFTIQSQERIPRLSESAEISILTIGPGPELYDSFGHTAVRVNDPERNIDAVFNYGLFDFDTPNFFLKFASGKLLYKLGISPYDNFLENYKEQRRWVKSQLLDQTYQERQQLFEFLFINAQEENSRYLYDFLYDNCATRPVDAVKSIYPQDLFKEYKASPENLTHRGLIRKNVPWNTWGMFGMDIAIGSVTDRPVTSYEYLFLPEYTMDAFAKAEILKNGKTTPLVSTTETLFSPSEPNTYRGNFMTSPLLILGLIALFLLYKTYVDFKNEKGIYVLDRILLGVLGIIGVLLALLWFATDHKPTQWNYNLLWAFPFHIIAAFIVLKKNPPRWIYPYMKLAVILLTIIGFHWIVGVQKFHVALIPVIVAILVRYLYILSHLKRIRDSA